MMLKDRKAGRLIAGVLMGAAMLGVTAAGGCGSTSKVESNSATVGQELQDLDTARNKGLLTEDEYNKQREEILKRK
jgi:hypothetical protein